MRQQVWCSFAETNVVNNNTVWKWLISNIRKISLWQIGQTPIKFVISFRVNFKVGMDLTLGWGINLKPWLGEGYLVSFIWGWWWLLSLVFSLKLVLCSGSGYGYFKVEFRIRFSVEGSLELSLRIRFGYGLGWGLRLS